MQSFDSVWEERYSGNPAYRNRYPWSAVVSFVMAEAPRGQPRHEVAILEVGCGTGNNLWFCAREGFAVSGIDGSATAINWARHRFAEDGLAGDLQVGDFTELPFADAAFDLCIDRAALSFVPRPAMAQAMKEVSRVLRPGGKLLCTPYSDRCSSFYRSPDADGAVRDVRVGSITGGSQVCFYGLQEVRDLFADGWTIRSLRHVEETDMTRPTREVHAEWQVIAEKTP